MEEEYQQYANYAIKKLSKQHNTLPLWGNEASMNLNPLILANIQGSSYFKVTLFKLKTYHEVVDEIYYQVKHLEPWERGSRKTSGQTGMCGGVRGVGAGGIVSTAFCLLYKLYTLRLTRKQVNGLLNHTDSPYIRALGFMYIRFTQPPSDIYDWYEDYFQDEEEIDVKAGGGQIISIGQMAYQFLTKLDWFSTLFPRIPVPIQKQIEKRLEQYSRDNAVNLNQLYARTSTAVGNGNNYASRGNDTAATERDYYGSRGGNATREDYYTKSSAPTSTYKTEHDDRGYDYQVSSTSYRRRDDRSPQPDERYGDKEKHKKKHKRRNRSRSRSYSNSRSHVREHGHRKHHRESSSKERYRDKDPHSDRKYR